MPDYVKFKNGKIVKVIRETIFKDGLGGIGFEYEHPLPFTEQYPFDSVFPATEEAFISFTNKSDEK